MSRKIRSDFFDLFLISFVSLFLELSFIRWIPGVVSCMSYFTNLVLIATFLGLGVGCAICGRNIKLAYLPASFVALATAVVILEIKGVSVGAEISDFIFLTEGIKAVPMVLAVPLVFFLIFVIFVFIGVILGKCLGNFKPLKSYSINIFASIVGIAIFTLLSFEFAAPYLWFLIGVIALLRFLKKQLILAGPYFLFFLFMVYMLGNGQIWSPYYKLQIRLPVESEFFSLTVNNDYQQQAHDFSLRAIASDSSARHWKAIYNLPYLFIQPKKVLIVGSGVGNDILLAKENNTAQIDAVEIDPGIINIGKQLRPDKPYSGQEVNVFIDDARSYMNNSKQKYDLIVYGFLDSHALFANMASVRLDNFVYTVEGIKQAKNLLSKDGTIALSFFVGRYWVGNKIYYMLKEVFGRPPLVYVSDLIPTEQIFVISLDKQKMIKKDIHEFSEISGNYELSEKLPLPTDNWPYFYLENKTIPSQYVLILSIILILSTGTIFLLMSKNKNLLDYSAFCFLGTAFMLIETKSIVQLSLLFGTTWLVNAIVIAGILIMILVANLYAIKFKPQKIGVFYIWLSITLLISWVLSPNNIALTNPVLKILLSVMLVTIPLFFASIIFAFLFRNAKDVSIAFGMNLLGVVLGGFLEYCSLIWGLNNLALLALGLYVVSYLVHRRVMV